MLKDRKNKGITLVALVITIIILLVLAGISISALTNTGIFEKAKDAKQKSEEAKKQEESMLSEYEDELSKYTLNDSWKGKVNKPELMTGMTAIQFTEPTDSTEGEKTKVSDISKNDWYNYDEKKWANAQTEDGSMWVWIPRYAYKVVYNDPNDKSKGGKFDIVFLIGTTDNYMDDNGNIQTAQRQTSENEIIETDSTKTDKYTVHPAFTNETKINYANGGWKKELTGIWVAKFEAGYFDKEKESNKIKASSVNYSQAYSNDFVNCDSNDAFGIKDTSRNYIDGIYAVKNGEKYEWKDGKKVSIKYPTFQGLKYSMNYINNSDAFQISRALTEKGNIYGLSMTVTDSHLMKNSEWGAIAYLGQSKYGLNGINIRINNVNVNDSKNYVYAMTGYAAKNEDEGETQKENAYKWTEKNGQTSSCTGTIYGVYDLSGGTWKKVAAVVNNNNIYLEEFNQTLMENLNNGKSTEYVTVYETDTKNDNIKTIWNNENLNIASIANYNKNQKYGDAVKEVSTTGLNPSWNNDSAYVMGLYYPTISRGGAFSYGSLSGEFWFSRMPGSSEYIDGFRSVLVTQ